MQNYLQRAQNPILHQVHITPWLWSRIRASSCSRGWSASSCWNGCGWYAATRRCGNCPLLTYDGDLNSVVELNFACGGCHSHVRCVGLLECSNGRWGWCKFRSGGLVHGNGSFVVSGVWRGFSHCKSLPLGGVHREPCLHVQWQRSDSGMSVYEVSLRVWNYIHQLWLTKREWSSSFFFHNLHLLNPAYF